MTVKQRSARKFGFSPADHGDILEIGPGATSSAGAIVVVQFVPSNDFIGSATVMGKVFGPAAQDAQAALMPVPYRRVVVNNVASDYAIVVDAITGASLIQVPANGLSIALFVACTRGSCQVVSWDLQGAFM